MFLYFWTCNFTAIGVFLPKFPNVDNQGCENYSDFRWSDKLDFNNYSQESFTCTSYVPSHEKTLEKGLQISPSKAIPPELNKELKLESLELKVELLDTTNTISMVIGSHVEETQKDRLVKKFSEKTSEFEWDFIFSFDLLDFTHRICFHSLLFTHFSHMLIVLIFQVRRFTWPHQVQTFGWVE